MSLDAVKQASLDWLGRLEEEPSSSKPDSRRLDTAAGVAFRG
jgi:hypothetical protein